MIYESLSLMIPSRFFFPLQLEHARLTQTELMRESFRHNQEMNELLQKQEELQERLTEEARAREQLALELHRAEGACFKVHLSCCKSFLINEASPNQQW